MVKKKEDYITPLSDAIDELKANFKDLKKPLFYFLILPSIISTLIFIGFFMSSPDVQAMAFSTDGNFIHTPATAVFTLIMFIVGLVTVVCSYFFTAGIIGCSLSKTKNRKYKPEKFITEAKRNFWRYIILLLITGIILLLILIATIIVLMIILLPLVLISSGKIASQSFAEVSFFTGFIIGFIVFIYFIIFWSLSGQVLIKENVSSLDALKRSKKLIKNRWLKTLSYFLIIGLLTYTLFFFLMTPILLLESQMDQYTYVIVESLFQMFATFLFLSLHPFHLYF